MNESPRKQLELGAEILAPALEPFGFSFTLIHDGNGSGGPFAAGRFARGSRELSLHHRWGLGIVTFGNAEMNLPHSDYLKFLGTYNRSKFSWTALDSGLDRYRALRFDLENLCSDFTTGDASRLDGAAREYAERIAQHGIQLNAEAVGDLEKRRMARAAFKNELYDDVIELMESIAYPDLISPSETRMVEIARSRTLGT